MNLASLGNSFNVLNPEKFAVVLYYFLRQFIIWHVIFNR